MGTVTTRDGVEIFFKDWGPRDAQPIAFHHGWPLSADAGPLSAKLLRNAKTKFYPGFPHGMPTTQADRINADLLEFIRG